MAYRETEKGRRRLAKRRAHMLKAAAELVDRDGLEALNVNTAAARAGVAVGTLYHHFVTRDNLVAELVVDQMRSDAAAMDAAALASKTALSGIAAALTVFLHLFNKRRLLAPAIVHSPSYRGGIIDKLESWITAAIRRDELPEIDARTAAAAVYGALTTACLAGPPGNSSGKNEPQLVLWALRAIGVPDQKARKLATTNIPAATKLAHGPARSVAD